MAKPATRRELVLAIGEDLKARYDDPTVEFTQTWGPEGWRIRVSDDRGMPMYFRVQVIKEL